MTSPAVARIVEDARELSTVELAAVIADLLDLQVTRAVAAARADIDANPIKHEVGV